VKYPRFQHKETNIKFQDPISRKTLALGGQEHHGQRGNLLPSMEKAKEEEGGGGLCPSLFGWRRSAAGGTIITAIITINFVVTLPQTYVIPCLNMVFDGIYYLPMTYCIAIMSE
jgi:hypothetical protein